MHTSFTDPRSLESTLENRLSLDYRTRQVQVIGQLFQIPVTITGGSLRSNLFRNPLLFIDCIFELPVEVTVLQFAGHVTFQNCIFQSSLLIRSENTFFEGTNIYNGDLSIVLQDHKEHELKDMEIAGTFQLIGDVKSLTIKNINTTTDLKRQVMSLQVTGEKFQISLAKGKNLIFSDAFHFTSPCRCTSLTYETIDLGKITADAPIEFDNCEIGTLCIPRLEGNERNIKILNSNIQKFEFGAANLSTLSVIKSAILEFQVYGANENNSFLSLEKTSFKILRFTNLLNSGLITLRDLRIDKDGVFSIRSSNFGKADFINCNFSKAALEFENSKITEAFFSETEFPKKVLAEGKRSNAQAQLAFGQLATAFQKQGDNIRALEYSSRELEAHYNNISLFSENFFQKINLWLNFVSNNFGRSWFKGSLFSFVVGLFFFVFLLVSTERFHWGIPSFNIEFLPAYLKFMNPLRFYELETLFKNTPMEKSISLTPMSFLADFGGRIFVAYGFYQTIQAFRRFGKK